MLHCSDSANDLSSGVLIHWGCQKIKLWEKSNFQIIFLFYGIPSYRWKGKCCVDLFRDISKGCWLWWRFSLFYPSVCLGLGIGGGGVRFVFWFVFFQSHWLLSKDYFQEWLVNNSLTTQFPASCVWYCMCSYGSWSSKWLISPKPEASKNANPTAVLCTTGPDSFTQLDPKYASIQ